MKRLFLKILLYIVLLAVTIAALWLVVFGSLPTRDDVRVFYTAFAPEEAQSE